MCTLIAIHRRVPGLPLVVAANRDEYLSRPAEGPALRMVRSENGKTVISRASDPGNAGDAKDAKDAKDEGAAREVAIVAPLDLAAGGTWLGVNARGVFAALTNLRSSDPDPKRRSRGLLVMDLLGGGSGIGSGIESAREAQERLRSLPVRTYNPFNLFVADAERAYLLVYQDAPRLHELEPGVHVIGNANAGEAAVPKVERVLERAMKAAGEPRERLLKALAGVCREHGSGMNPLDDTCVHVAGTYGTRSSILLELAESHDESRLFYADGPPCEAPYEDFTSLLTELRQTPGYGCAEIQTRTTS